MLKPLSLINSFNKIADENNLDIETQMIYYKLWSLWNETRRPDSFSIDNKRLMELTRIKSEKLLVNRRKKLIELNLINFVPGKKGQASTYNFLDCSKNCSKNGSENCSEYRSKNCSKNELSESAPPLASESTFSENCSENCSEYRSKNCSENGSENCSHNKSIKRDIENNILFFNSACARDDIITQTESQVLNFYQGEIVSALGGTMGAGEISCLREYAQVYGADETIRALKKSLQCAGNLKGIALVKYAGGILRNWATYGEQERTAPKKINSGRAIDSLRALMEG